MTLMVLVLVLLLLLVISMCFSALMVPVARWTMLMVQAQWRVGPVARSEAANARVETAKGLTWRLTCRYHVTDPEHHVAVSLDRAVMLVPKHRAANTLIQETSARVPCSRIGGRTLLPLDTPEHPA